MKHLMLAAMFGLFAFSAHAQTQIDAISTTFRWLGPNDKTVVEWYDDPRVQHVS